ncbi:hypothetical protein [Mycolicibacterium nivoides]|uniref:Uncharacterized protein n=1 Tax=Mycolicibacterium nivoides TaxID=2487344 RepID=A0ABW9L913_9MYCO
MRKWQLAAARRGVELLLNHLNNATDSLDTALAAEDGEACERCADPLVTVAVILTRQLRDATNGTIETALTSARSHVDREIPSEDDIDMVSQIIVDLISARKPRQLPIDSVMVALVAQEMAIGAANEIARIENRHPNNVIAKLYDRLNKQGDNVQISDRDAAIAASEEYAADPKMREARQKAAFNIVNHWNDAANILDVEAGYDTYAQPCRESLGAVSLVTVTCAALTAGIYQLAEKGNLYPAMGLLRQLVECEFILWKFAQDSPNMVEWINSTPDQLAETWRPSKIYRNADNDYRQKDYGGHCVMGGHPNPIGSRLAGGIDSFRPLASLFGDEIRHSYDAWQHMKKAITLIDSTYGTKSWDQFTALNTAFETTIMDCVAVDERGYATAYFSDPIDD